MTQMTARYGGTCAKTGAKIRVGDLIDYDRATRKATLVIASKPAGGGLKKSYHNTDLAIERGQGRYVSDVFRNKAGRCEDAPCCGCCTI